MKKIYALLLVCVMLMGFTVVASAEPSPEVPPVEPTETVVPTSPQTGEGRVLVYSMMAVCLCAGIATVSFYKMK